MRIYISIMVAIIMATSMVVNGKGNKPNVIVIMVDDLGYGDLGCYGSEIPTPQIDKLAEEGMRLTQFYVGGSVCTPSRYTLLTGCYPQRSAKNLTGAIMPGQDRSLVDREQTLAEYLKRVDYKTGLIGKWHLGHFKKEALPTHHGFDFFYGFGGGCVDYFEHTYGDLERDWYHNDEFTKEKGYATHLITNHAVNYIDTVKTDNPYFLMLSYNAPHFGKTTLTRKDARTLMLKEYELKGVKLMNTLQVPMNYIRKVDQIDNIYRKYYAAMVVALDEGIGQVMDKLKEKGQMENTVVWFLSDNGAYSKKFFGHGNNGELRDEKGSLYDGGIRVPSICVWPQKIKAGVDFDGVVASHDILPTLQSILEFRTDYPVDGIDVSASLFKQRSIGHKIYWKTHAQKAYRNGKWKLVVTGKKMELFDMKTDMKEQNNMAEERPEIVTRMLAEWKQTDQQMK